MDHPASRAIRLRDLALVAGSVALTLALFEASLQLLVGLGAVRSYRSMYAGVIDDPELVWRFRPRAYAEIDDRGYRNPEALVKADIVAIGDSQTYGYNAFSQDSWPGQLARMTGKRVYNMGVGGWGPAQYYRVLDEALALDPETVVLGFYFGNDLYDVCSAFALPAWQRFATENDIDPGPCQELAPPARVDDRPALDRLRDLPRSSELLMRLKQLPIVQRYFMFRRDLAIAEQDPAMYFLVHDDEVATIVQLRPRMQVLDPSIPEVAAGKRLAKLLWNRIIDEAAPERIVVMLIPTKASVLYDHLVSRKAELPAAFHELVSVERDTVREFTSFFAERGVATVDVRPHLARGVEAREPLFLGYADGHPTALGYRLMAEAVFEQHFQGRTP
jgi:hypothetical protein